MRIAEWIGAIIQTNENAAIRLVIWVIVLFFLLPIVLIYIV